MSMRKTTPLSDSKSRLLKRLCEESDHPFHRMGAILYKGGAAISVGFNKTGSSKLMTRNHRLRPFAQTLHAEVSAVIGVSKEEASKCDLIVGRITAGGSFALAKPCAMCQAVLKQMRVRRVYFTTGGYEDGSPQIEQLTEENKESTQVCYHV